ncbi:MULTISPECIES: NAD-dependent epimerase/dehydratase family protein [Marinobacter]|uniref:NAD-dependent epimerase/dehydratase family protein n=1 Tax=Marinobacter TaxID=2742 RepID=UPI0017870F7B|nr:MULTISPECIES: NAD(P)-dependent oxidoreductase [Marinobacter]MBJ7275814.1 NAD(P)-dependent oxidoreductase [Marinobacter salarius]MBL3558974.1 NAD(P)-dependent oxidoreductase [Marinobacter sp. JB05H06]
MTTLVTGGLGVIGSMVAREMVAAGERPVLFDLPAASPRLLSDLLTSVDIVRGDLLDQSNLEDVIRQKKVDRIIHTAAYIDPELGRDVVRSIQVNILAAMNIFELARAHKQITRVVWCSSRAVYSEMDEAASHPHYQPITEDYPQVRSTDPKKLYDSTKLFCEHLMMKYVEDLGLDIIALRFGSTFSPGKTDHHGPLAVVSQIVEKPLRGEPVHIPRGGQQKNDFIYNRDTAHALILASQVENVQHRIFHIGSGEGRSLRDFAESVTKVIPEARIQIGDGLDYLNLGRQMYAIFDITRAKEELGFQPRYTTDTAVEDYIALVRTLNL